MKFFVAMQCYRIATNFHIGCLVRIFVFVSVYIPSYSRLSNKRDGWNKRDGRKICKILVLKFTTHQQISNLSVFLDISSYI